MERPATFTTIHPPKRGMTRIDEVGDGSVRLRRLVGLSGGTALQHTAPFAGSIECETDGAPHYDRSIAAARAPPQRLFALRSFPRLSAPATVLQCRHSRCARSFPPVHLACWSMAHHRRRLVGDRGAFDG